MPLVEIYNTQKGKDYPSLKAQAVNVTQAGARAVSALLANQQVRREPSEVERVKAICKSQTDGCFDAQSERCKKCGCRMNTPLVGKWNWATEHCPKGLW